MNIAHWRTSESIEKIVSNMSKRPICSESGTFNRRGVLIRYGYTGPASGRIVYNRAQSIMNAADKIEARAILADAGIPIPETVLPGETANLAGTWISRPRFHTRGNSFIVIKNDKRKALRHLRSGRYLSRIFKKTEEYRVHCGHGKILLVQCKNCGNALNSSRVSSTSDWTVLTFDEYNNAMCKTALKAVWALGLDFGAVDIIYNSHTRKFVVLEVNTAPSLPGQIAPRKYALYFDYLDSKKVRKHNNWRKDRIVKKWVMQ